MSPVNVALRDLVEDPFPSARKPSERSAGPGWAFVEPPTRHNSLQDAQSQLRIMVISVNKWWAETDARRRCLPFWCRAKPFRRYSVALLRSTSHSEVPLRQPGSSYFIPRWPLPHQTNPSSRRGWKVSLELAGNQRQNLEVRFDSANNVSGSPLWRAFVEAFVIGISDKTEP